MAVLTSCIPELCRAALARHGVLDWFQGVVYAQETGIGKGEPELYRLAAERWGREPEECILFEDSPGYCAAAREAGFFVAGVRDPLYAGREEEIQGLCRGWVEDFRQVSEPIWAQILTPEAGLAEAAPKG